MSVGKFPLELDYAENVAKHWLDLEHASGVVEYLPKEIVDALPDQSDEFLLGFINAIAVAHDLAVKPLVDDIRMRNPSGVTEDPRDILVTRVGSAVEGVSYVACSELVERKDREDG